MSRFPRSSGWLVSLGYDVRFYRTAILEEVSQDYVRTARAKGLAEKRVFFKHVLKNSMIPILTNVVLEIPLLILGAFLLEGFFGIPGLGQHHDRCGQYQRFSGDSWR